MQRAHMSHHFDPAEALRQQPALRESWIDRVIALAKPNPQIAALWAVGSVASGEADNWSDVDIIVSCRSPDHRGTSNLGAGCWLRSS